MIDTLIHQTLETGHERLSPVSEAVGDGLALLRPLVREALKHVQPLHVGAAFWMQAADDAGRLEAKIWHGPEPIGPPLVEVSILRPDPAAHCLPVLQVSISNLSEADPDVTATLGDIERCLAWVWLS